MSLGRVINSPAQPTTKSTETNRSQKYQMALSFKARLITIALKISIQWLFTVWISIASESCEIMRSTCPIVDDVDGFMRNNEIKYANNVAAELIVNVLCFFFSSFRVVYRTKAKYFCSRGPKPSMSSLWNFSIIGAFASISCARARDLCGTFSVRCDASFIFCVLRLKGTILFV